MLFGFREAVAKGKEDAAHRSGYTAFSLRDLLSDAGFSNMRISRQGFTLWALAYKFALSDPRRSDKVQILIDEQEGKLKLPDPLPLNRTKHPGLFAPNSLTDELDLPPKQWEPLGLKDTA